jgi:uncharacterized damage-inducible protein DinB
MDLTEALLQSWDRQCRIVDAVATLIDDQNRHDRASEDGMRLDQHLAHMHGVRRFFLSQVAPDFAANLKSASSDSEGTPLEDLNQIKAYLKESESAVRAAVKHAIETDTPFKSEHIVYDTPVLFLQHMVWHDGWHIGLIFLALRLNGQEPPESWEEPNVWGQWRTETW